MFKFIKTEIPDVIIIESERFTDSRGYFTECFRAPIFNSNGLPSHFEQDNYSKSRKGVIRGLHYQLNPMAQGKLINVIRGRAFDVAVDIRKGSPYFGKWVSVELSEENNKSIWMPAGFAHGVASLEDETTLHYKTTAIYSSEYERGIRWDDPRLNIRWPEFGKPILSDKDAKYPKLEDSEINFEYGANKQ